jgi:excisionase family DNA binding protein
MTDSNFKPEPLLTIHEAADRLGLHRWLLSRAVRRGLFPSYSILNGRRRVRLSEIVAAINKTRKGGSDA